MLSPLKSREAIDVGVVPTEIFIAELNKGPHEPEDELDEEDEELDEELEEEEPD